MRSLYTWSQGTLQYCAAAHDSHYPVSAAGVWADTLRNLRPVVHNEHQSLPGRKGYPEGHAHLVRHLGGTRDRTGQGAPAAHRSGQHLLSLINDVAEISRIEAGRTGPHSEPFDLNAAIAAVEEMIRLRAEPPTEEETPRDEPAAKADLSTLPGEARRALAQAAEQLDEAECLKIAAGLSQTHPGQARLIRELVNGFRFDRVLALCGEEAK